MSSVKKNPEETHIFAILYPAEGKMQRVSRFGPVVTIRLTTHVSLKKS